jgi:uncharacterized membrane protein
MLSIVGLVILIGYISLGFFFVNLNFMRIIQVGVKFSFVFIIFKLAFLFSNSVKRGFKKFSNFQLNKKKYLSSRESKISYKKFLKKEFVYFASIFSLFLSLNIIIISVPIPGHKITADLDENELLIDFHGHTIFSDGWLTPEQRVIWYIDHGINAAAFSDHDNLNGYYRSKNFVERYNLNFEVIQAVEYTDHQNDIHLNYYGVDDLVVPLESKTLNGPIAMNVSDMINYIKNKGGYIIVNHYNEDINSDGEIGAPYSLKDLKSWGVDGFEILNGGKYQGNIIREFCLNNSLICLGGTDIHTNEELMSFVKLSLTDRSNLTVENIFSTLYNNTHQIIQIQLYPQIFNFPYDDDLGFGPLENFLNYLYNAGKFKILSWVVWSSLIYLVMIFLTQNYRKKSLKRVS